jgi:2-polyprenyl-3-methyl-5-hydroxy-6-metoxy-1,4-benzoquinol methylase
MVKMSKFIVILFIGVFLLSNFLDSNECKAKSTKKEEIDHASELPSIECPLRKQGINLHDLKPFKEAQKYIEFLERKDREIWQKPDAVIKELSLKGTEKIADVGAGSGYFTFRLSKELPKGKVYAIDIEPEMIRYIHHKTVLKKIQNVEVIFSTPDNPNIPEDADLVFICDVLHHVKNKGDWLKALFSQMKNNSKLVLIEFKEGKLPEGPPEDIKIPLEKMISITTDAGFINLKQNEELLPYQYYLEFKR